MKGEEHKAAERHLEHLYCPMDAYYVRHPRDSEIDKGVADGRKEWK